MGDDVGDILLRFQNAVNVLYMDDKWSRRGFGNINVFNGTVRENGGKPIFRNVIAFLRCSVIGFARNYLVKFIPNSPLTIDPLP